MNLPTDATADGAAAAAKGSSSTLFDPKKADALLASDLYRMSVDERNFVFEDIHGVRSLSEEENDPSKMKKSLEAMDLALEKIESKDAYYDAVTIDSDYVLRNEELRIRFLRAEKFDASKAAQRFVHYLDFYRELFGNIALVRPIYFDDLSKSEQSLLREGCQQLLPCRDRTGRRIYVRIGNMKGAEENQFSQPMLRITHYIFQVLSEDVRTQQYGCAMVLYAGSYANNDNNYSNGETKFLKDPNIRERMKKCHQCLPFRISSMHYCMPNTVVYKLASAAILLLSTEDQRVRTRFHYGSQMECKYSLMTFGIPGDQLPVTSSGFIKLVNHQRWINFLREKEMIQLMNTSGNSVIAPFEGIDCPRAMDILIGNSGHNTSHFKSTPGNVMYLELLLTYLKQYHETSDSKIKTKVTWQVFEKLKDAGSRILVRDKRGWWKVANTDRAREKIAHDFRETIRKSGINNKRKRFLQKDAAMVPLSRNEEETKE